MRVKTMVAGVAAGVLGLGSLVGAEPPGGPGRRGGRGPMEGVASYLGLTDEQKAQLADEREKMRPQAQSLFAKMKANREKMRQALEAPAPDPATVGAIAIEGHELQLQMQAHREASEKALRAMLTPEQQTKLDALQALRRSRPGRMGPMPFGPPPHDDIQEPGGPGDEPPPHE